MFFSVEYNKESHRSTKSDLYIALAEEIYLRYFFKKLKVNSIRKGSFRFGSKLIVERRFLCNFQLQAGEKDEFIIMSYQLQFIL